MEKINQFEASNPLATIEQIQKRLTRPSSSSLHSQSSSSFLNSSHRKLEDYLHPLLLSTIRAKVGRKRKSGGEGLKETKIESESNEFDRFDHELNICTGGLVSEKEKKMKRNDVVDLNCDTDSIGGGGGDYGSDEEEGVVECSPFRRFEITALKRFK